ncbi:hypothetical protein [Nostoc sp. LEGE 12450]|uniref:hypothetical protein n=1 Tax=Nostoc sp. LEGE 12450 TaxID=1828643 RepID=UPI0018815433|nr:hypothetical protein [Nostoc sp. LEGE 12450]MBE8992310.1 hypothetical protein [Nostoc sp. LEGE 12450]
MQNLERINNFETESNDYNANFIKQYSLIQKDKIRSQYLTAFYLLFFTLILIFIMVFSNAEIGIKQALIVLVGLVTLFALNLIKQTTTNNNTSALPLVINQNFYDNKQYETSNNHYYNQNQKQNLAEAAAEIQQLLDQLSQNKETKTESEKLTMIAEVVDEIESNPPLKSRLVQAIKAGGSEALKDMVSNPLINIFLATIKGWETGDDETPAS